ncbi:UDP pyrophosphate phosphatase [Achromatium sp. WMS3]|nr:UDP pyrophosphate phosphatase [Achromatium sp. WMS3]
MDYILLLKALILGIVEGLTEFLPISSTGHLILSGHLLNFNDAKGKVFEIAIQLAAILAVVWEYRVSISEIIIELPYSRKAQRFAVNIILAFLPAAILGLLFIKVIKAYLFNPISVATAFIIGGVLILWAERREHRIRVRNLNDIPWIDALKIGFAQSLALIPGTSRSGATILGGLFVGLERKVATEFSFFLAIPTMFAATLYDVIKNRHLLDSSDIPMFLVGGIASFIAAFLAVRGLLRYISRHDFTIFAWYRIAFGIIVLLTAYTGLISWTESG